MLGRRDLIRAGGLGLMLATAGGVLEACGSAGPKAAAPTSNDPRAVTPISTGPVTGGVQMVAAEVARGSGDSGLLSPVVTALDGFAAELYAGVAGQQGNLVISPYSVALALSMTLAGGRGRTASQLQSALGATALGDRWHDGMNALATAVDGLAGKQKRADGSTATVGMSTADALFGQRGIRWQPAFLEQLARDYGAGMQTVDFADPDRVADLVDAWVAQHTDDRITDLIPHGALTRDDRLVLVNAVSLTAPWEMPFDRSSTRPGAFHLDGGGTVRADLMRKPEVGVTLVSGDGWSAARIPYAGSTLAMTVVLPDSGRFAEVEAGLDGQQLATILGAGRAASVTLTLPRWTSRTTVALGDVLKGLGVTEAFSVRADFSGMTTQERLVIAAVLHEGYIKVDEDGTEAAAATAVLMGATSAQVDPPSFTVDRPFLYVLHDTAHGTPLFIGRVTDPTA